MFRNSTLTSIPERNESENECGQKWVPKKKHEVLKAKYKCLKKLFQIYDANVIGFLPDPSSEFTEEMTTKRRRKRSHRTKTDACAGTTEYTNGDITQSQSEIDKKSVTTSHSVTSTQVESHKCETSYKYQNKECECSKSESNCSKFAYNEIEKYPEIEYSHPHDYNFSPYCNKIRRPMPYSMMTERRKLTRFQCFVQRLLGIRRETYEFSDNKYAASDSYANRKRRRGLRFRRLRRSKKIKSDTDLKDMKCPEIMSYVQSVQRSCLMDNTPRQCPIVGCKMISYGIINYNDHLNLCHFNGRKFICHYCHEGFEKENDKFAHEYEHIGLNKVTQNLLPSVATSRQSSKTASNTQTDPESKHDIPEEKLMKIVSFFDKMVKQEAQFQKNGQSESCINSGADSECDSDKRTASCMNIGRKELKKDSTEILQRYSATKYSNPSSLSCQMCGEHFPHRRQLSLHVDIEHRMHNRFSKFHSCAGIMNQQKRIDLISEDGQINIQSNKSSSEIQSCTEVMSDIKSEVSLTCDPSNIVYCPSKPSIVDSLVKKVKGYRWEPQTKIIRV